MKKMYILGVEVKTYNKREEQPVNILNNEINDCKRWRDDNTFRDKTFAVLYDTLNEVNHQFCCLFYMGLTKQESIVN